MPGGGFANEDAGLAHQDKDAGLEPGAVDFARGRKIAGD